MDKVADRHGRSHDLQKVEAVVSQDTKEKPSGTFGVLTDEGIAPISLNPDTIIETWQQLAKSAKK